MTDQYVTKLRQRFLDYMRTKDPWPCPSKMLHCAQMAGLVKLRRCID